MTPQQLKIPWSPAPVPVGNDTAERRFFDGSDSSPGRATENIGQALPVVVRQAFTRLNCQVAHNSLVPHQKQQNRDCAIEQSIKIFKRKAKRGRMVPCPGCSRFRTRPENKAGEYEDVNSVGSTPETTLQLSLKFPGRKLPPSPRKSGVTTDEHVGCRVHLGTCARPFRCHGVAEREIAQLYRFRPGTATAERFLSSKPWHQTGAHKHRNCRGCVRQRKPTYDQAINRGREGRGKAGLPVHWRFTEPVPSENDAANDSQQAIGPPMAPTVTTNRCRYGRHEQCHGETSYHRHHAASMF